LKGTCRVHGIRSTHVQPIMFDANT